MNQQINEKFLQKLRDNLLSKEEQDFFQHWLTSAPKDEVEEVLQQLLVLFQEATDRPYAESERISALIESRIDMPTDKKSIRISTFRKLIRLPYFKIAAIAASACIIWLIWPQKQDLPSQSQSVPTVSAEDPILPGNDKAILVLSNGKQIILDSVDNGLLATEKSVAIKKENAGSIAYVNATSQNPNTGTPTYNTIKIPRGGQYQVVLPDGTKVWLNAQSSIRFSPEFSGHQRLIALEGEAYFEVAKDHTRPFRVTVKNSTVEVLGTHFNMMAYPDEPMMKTSLLEGSVKIIHGDQTHLIHPGEQAVVNGKITVSTANVFESVEWKNGNFNFENEKLETIMRKIARWYDIQVDYQANVTDASFVGTIPRSQSINEVLKYLELTGVVHFNVKGRRVTVMP